MAFVGSRVTVDTTAGGTAIVSGPSVSSAVRVNVMNRGSVAVYLGGSGVTSAAGYQLDPSASISCTVPAGETLYGITASSSAVVHVLKGGA